MNEIDRVAAWIDGYVAAWNSNDPVGIGALFTDDAQYRGSPYGAPWVGRSRIVQGWLEHQDQPGETSFDWRPVVLTPGLAVVEGTTTYHPSASRPTRQTFSNLWLIRLDENGRCHSFTEWWMQHPEPGPSSTSD